jgi:hypothetical protein
VAAAPYRNPMPQSTDVASTHGYGSYQQPINYTPYVNQLPEVMAARSALGSQGMLANQQEQQQLSQLIGGFGDPTALPGMAPGGKTLSQLLGQNVDPATAAIARANTMGPNGAIGGSTIAQLYLAGQSSLRNAWNNSIPMGAVGSSQSGYAMNQANMANARALADATAKFQSTGTGYINTAADTLSGLHQKLADAIATGTQTVIKDPSSYPLPTPKTVNVGVDPNPTFPNSPQHPMGVPAAPTGVAAAGRAATQASRGYMTPTPTVHGVTPGLGSGPYQTGPGFPTNPKSPTGPGAFGRSITALNRGYINPTPTMYHPNYGVA